MVRVQRAQEMSRHDFNVIQPIASRAAFAAK